MGQDGPFAEQWPSFVARAGQQDLALAIAETIDSKQTLVAEAATGTGKTLAYLVPLLSSGKTALISTGTRNLQEQLYHRDLPAVLKVMQQGARIALLKGRNNYLCRYRLELSRSGGRLRSPELVHQLQQVYVWSARTSSGDLAELIELPEDARIRPLVTSTTENCLGGDCPFYDDCHVYQARREAMRAQITVVNHHLLFADLALKEQGHGEVLPDVDTIIIDEAHQAPVVAAQFFGTTFSHRQLTALLNDALTEADAVSGLLSEVREASSSLDLAQREALLAFSVINRRVALKQVLDRQVPLAILDDLAAGLETLEQRIISLDEPSSGLQQIAARTRQLQSALCLFREPQQEYICWFEPRLRGFALHATPLNVSKVFADVRAPLNAAWVLTSATLTVNGGFDYFSKRLGLEDSRKLMIGSPFDYANRTCLWLPRELPPAGDRSHTEALLKQVLPLLKANKGRTFLLFTTHRALRDAAGWLHEYSDFDLQVQGEAPRGELLQRFLTNQHSGNGSVLLGAASFWEGIDVAGAALSMVVIDKLPFASPDDPVLQARSESIRQEGGNPFVELSLPESILALKQGVGRLIRGHQDYGVVVIGDTRLSTKAYGRQFINSLPEMPQVDTQAQVLAFMGEFNEKC